MLNSRAKQTKVSIAFIAYTTEMAAQIIRKLYTIVNFNCKTELMASLNATLLEKDILKLKNQ